jgi:hypothetical protein
MDHTRWDCEYLSRLQTKCTAVREIYFQIAFYDQETLIGTRMLMPAKFSLHHRQSHAMIVNVHDNEILVGLVDRVGLLLCEDIAA